MTVALDEDLKSKIEIPKDEDNQLQTALEVFDEGVDAVNEKISAENGETAAADDDFEAKVKENLEIENRSRGLSSRICPAYKFVISTILYIEENSALYSSSKRKETLEN